MRSMMRAVMVSCSVALTGLATIGCSGKDGTASFGSDTGTVTGEIDDTGPGGDDGGGVTGIGEVYPDDDPLFSILISGETWELDPVVEGNLGYFTGNTLYAQLSTGTGTSQTVSIQIDGDLMVPGTYPVTYMSYTFQVAQDPPTVGDVVDPEGFMVTCLGFAETGNADATHIYAVSSGEATLSDGKVMSALETIAYPNFFAR